MPDLLEVCTREELRAVIHFLGSEDEKPADIYRRLNRQCGDKCVLLHEVYEWHRILKTGMSNFTDEAFSGQSHTVKKPDANAEVERLIGKNRRVTIGEVVGESKISLCTQSFTNCCSTEKSPPSGYQNNIPPV